MAADEVATSRAQYGQNWEACQRDGAHFGARVGANKGLRLLGRIERRAVMTKDAVAGRIC